MKLHLQVVSVLCALLSPVCFSSLTGLDKKFETGNDEVVRIKAFNYVHSPTNFSALPSSSVPITAPTVPRPHVPTNAQESLVKAMSTSTEQPSSGLIHTGGVVEPSIVFSSSNTPAVITTHVPHVLPTTTALSPPGSYTPIVYSVSPSIPSPPATTHADSHSKSAHTQPSIVPTRCAPTVTVTVNNGAYCTNTPPPAQVCSSDCSSKIGLSLGISIPATAILTFLVTSLSCLCCQRVKKKQSYIQLAPTVYFDEEEHD